MHYEVININSFTDSIYESFIFGKQLTEMIAWHSTKDFALNARYMVQLKMSNTIQWEMDANALVAYAHSQAALAKSRKSLDDLTVDIRIIQIQYCSRFILGPVV